MTMTASRPSWQSSTEALPRFATPRNHDRPTLGPAVAQVWEWLGLTPMPWQRQVLDVAYELNPVTGRLHYREVVVLTPRQAGKTSLHLGTAVHRCLVLAQKGGPQRVVYGAQNGVYARAKFLDEHVPMLERSELGRRKPPLFRVRRTNGHEQVSWRNGSRHGIVAATEKAGHGGTIDLVQKDEAFADVDARMEQGLQPTMATRPEPQFWITSTAGTPESTYLWGKVEAGRARVESREPSRTAYFEWSAPDDMDPGDPATWQAIHPALGFTIDQSAIEFAYGSMDLPEFKRAYLNVWDPRKGQPVIPLDLWLSLDDEGSEIADEQPVAVTFDVSPDQSSASVGVAGRRSDGQLHVEVIDHHPGTGWVVPRLLALQERWKPKVIAADFSGPSGELRSAVTNSGLTVRPVTNTEHGQACALFMATVKQHQLRHLKQAQLVSALDGATRRPLGDSWAWSRRNSSVDISPLVAVTLAGWALDAAPPEVDVMGGLW